MLIKNYKKKLQPQRANLDYINFIMSEIQKKIKSIIDEIQKIMESNDHLSQEQEKIDTLLLLFDKIELYWAHLNDEDNDYVSYAKHAFEDQTPWGKVDNKSDDDE